MKKIAHSAFFGVATLPRDASGIVKGLVVGFALVCGSPSAQVNIGGDRSHRAFHPTTNTGLNMADHPNGIYHYTSVDIPVGVIEEAAYG